MSARAVPAVTALDRVLGTTLLVLLVSAMTIAKASVVILNLLALLVLILRYAGRDEHAIRFPFSMQSTSILVLCAWALVSCAWAPNPLDGFWSVLWAMIAVSGAYLILVSLELQPARRIAHFSYWLVVGYAGSLAILLLVLLLDLRPISWLIEVLDLYRPGDGSRLIMKGEAGRVVVDPAFLNSSVASATLMLPGILVMAWSLVVGWRRYAVGGLLILGAVATALVTSHESSKLAIVVGVLIGVAAIWSKRAVRWFIAIAWSVAVMLVVPLCLYAYSGLKLHEASWLQDSARDRITVWADYALRAREVPILGAGVRAARHLNDVRTPALVERVQAEPQVVARHPHSVYLQTAFELGIVGSVLLLAAGLTFVAAAKGGSFAHPAYLATLAMAAIFLGLCWDFWQGWFVTTFAIAGILMAIAFRFSKDRALAP